VFLSIVTEQVPEVPEAARLTIEPLGRGLHRVIARYGFMEFVDLDAIVARCCRDALTGRGEDITYYVGRPQVLPTGRAPMARWRKHLFTFLARNGRSATQFFGIPRDRVVELGMQIEL
jgi:KUP system potassium uptake protein